MQAPALEGVVTMDMAIETSTLPSSEERNWAIAAHLSALVALVGFPFGHILGPLVVLLVQRDRSAFVTSHAKASLNFQITVSIATIILIAVMVVVWVAAVAVSAPSQNDTLPIAFVLAWILTAGTFLAGAIVVIAYVIAAAVAASKDRPYRYPFAITFIR